MSIASEITRIGNQRDTLRTNLIGLGLVTPTTTSLSAQMDFLFLQLPKPRLFWWAHIIG